jgi:rubredoxin
MVRSISNTQLLLNLIVAWVTLVVMASTTTTTTVDAFVVTTTSTSAFVTMKQQSSQSQRKTPFVMPLRMSDDPNPPSFSLTTTGGSVSPTTTTTSTSTANTMDPMSLNDPMSESLVDIETMKQLEKARRAQELRDQEVFMKKSTGKHQCSNCDWIFDITKGDSMMIGGQIKPNTPFVDTPSNWRCPVCRASKDSFVEIVEEIPGFEVNQGYGFGTNAWTAGQKNLAIFGGLGAFFILFLSGYALS